MKAFLLVTTLLCLQLSAIAQEQFQKKNQSGMLEFELNDSHIIHHSLTNALAEQRQNNQSKWEPYYLDSAFTRGQSFSPAKFIAEYNEYHKVSRFTVYAKSESGWDRIWRNTFSYNMDGKKTQELVGSWIDNQWKPWNEKNYFYNSNGNIELTLVRRYLYGSWGNYLRSLNNYNSTKQLISSNTEVWIDNVWVPDQRVLFSYNPEGLLKSQLEQRYLNNQYQDAFLLMRKYENGRLVRIEGREWAGQIWSKTHRIKITYYPNSRAEEIILQTWENVEWRNAVKTFYEYNSAGYLLFAHSEIWENNSWEPGNSNINVRNPDGMEVNYFAEEWRAYYGDTRIKMGTEAVEESPESYTLHQNYPNPFNPSTIINYSLVENTHVSLSVYNTLGEKVADLFNGFQEKGSYSINFDASDLPAGMYIYTINAGEFTSTKKMLLLK